MPRIMRSECTSGVYHVFNRGVGRQFIFEDSDDRLEFLELIARFSASLHVTILAWVLMDNHVHLLLQAPITAISSFMRTLQSTYASYFNKCHRHTGHLFQGRFGSQGIESDEQLLTVVRYIHRNPIEGGLCESLDYAWSSYQEYTGQPSICDITLVSSMFDNLAAFQAFHAMATDAHIEIETKPRQPAKPSNSRALRIAEHELGPEWRELLLTKDKRFRDTSICKLKACGLSIRQIERMTGIGRGIIQRC